jgi:cation diffusion facilitator CzcD-associated flavoprotein CzcO
MQCHQSVVVIGTGASSDDISRELAEVAKEVHVSGRSWKSSVEFAKPVGRHQNIWLHSMVDPCSFLMLFCIFHCEDLP